MLDQLFKCIQCKKGVGYHVPRNLQEAETEVSIKLLCVRCYCKQNGILVKSGKGTFGKAKSGIRKDVHPDYFFRSSAESNFARILNYFGLRWKYENMVFKFFNDKDTPYKYIMDFEVLTISDNAKELGLTTGYYEVKGKLDRMTKKKLIRLRRDYPQDAAMTKVVLLTPVKKYITALEKLGYEYLILSKLKEYFKGDKIPTWE